MENLIKALVKARSEFDRVTKDSNNPFFKSKYADLASVVGAITPALSANGLVVCQPLEQTENGLLLKTQLWHESGEVMESTMAIPAIADIQKLGSAITYSRRYALSSLLGIAPEDDDGNAAASAPNGNGVKKMAYTTKKPDKPPMVKPPVPQPMSASEVQGLKEDLGVAPEVPKVPAVAAPSNGKANQDELPF